MDAAAAPTGLSLSELLAEAQRTHGIAGIARACNVSRETVRGWLAVKFLPEEERLPELARFLSRSEREVAAARWLDDARKVEQEYQREQERLAREADRLQERYGGRARLEPL